MPREMVIWYQYTTGARAGQWKRSGSTYTPQVAEIVAKQINSENPLWARYHNAVVHLLNDPGPDSKK